MDQRSIEKHLRRWHRRDKTSGDDLAGQVVKDNASEGRRHSATTGNGLSVEEQIRKEWDPSLGRGLPVFLLDRRGRPARAAPLNRARRNSSRSTRRARGTVASPTRINSEKPQRRSSFAPREQRRRISEPATAAGGDHRVAQKTGDRHRPHTTRHRSDCPGEAAHRREIDIAGEPAAAIRPGSGVIPASMTMAPGLTQSAPTISGRPTAATRMSARRAIIAWPRLFECTIVTVQSAAYSNAAIGLPTMLERPRTTASAPARSRHTERINIRQPCGVHGTSAGTPAHSRPTLTG